MTDCYECGSILAYGGESLQCRIKRYRKYLIGFAVGAVAVAIGMKLGGWKRS